MHNSVAGEAVGPMIGGGLTSAMPSSTAVNCSGGDCESGFPYAALVFGLLLSAYMAPLWVVLHEDELIEEPVALNDSGYKPPGYRPSEDVDDQPPRSTDPLNRTLETPEMLTATTAHGQVHDYEDNPLPDDGFINI